MNEKSFNKTWLAQNLSALSTVFKIWLTLNILLSITLTGFIEHNLYTDTSKSAYSEDALPHSITLSIYILVFSWAYFFIRLHKHNKQKKYIDTSIIQNYLKNNFQEYSVKKELTPEGRNKVFLLNKNTIDYILKITCKNKKRAHKEAVLLTELEGQLPAPKLISKNTSSLPGHILMTHCGGMLSESNDMHLYMEFGKIIPSIHSAIITNNILHHKKTGKIEKLIHELKTSHPYADYFDKYKTLSANYFCHGDLHINQVMIDNNSHISIIDWESATYSYRVFDLSRALSHSIRNKLSIDYARAILHGYLASSNLGDPNENKLLLSLIWYDLNKTNQMLIKNDAGQKNRDFIRPIIESRQLEEIFYELKIN